jgi:hypothetical protein
MHSINLTHQLIVTVTIVDVMVRFSRLLHVEHIIVLDEVDNFHNLSKIVSCVFKKHKRHYINGIILAHQLIIAVTIGDVMVMSSRLLNVGHIIALD